MFASKRFHERSIWTRQSISLAKSDKTDSGVASRLLGLRVGFALPTVRKTPCTDSAKQGHVFPSFRDHERITGKQEVGLFRVTLTYINKALIVEVDTSLHMSGLPTTRSCGLVSGCQLLARSPYHLLAILGRL